MTGDVITTIDPAEILAEIDNTPRCPDCRGGHMLVVDRDAEGFIDWHIARAHDVTCPTLGTLA